MKTERSLTPLLAYKDGMSQVPFNQVKLSHDKA